MEKRAPRPLVGAFVFLGCFRVVRVVERSLAIPEKAKDGGAAFEALAKGARHGISLPQNEKRGFEGPARGKEKTGTMNRAPTRKRQRRDNASTGSG